MQSAERKKNASETFKARDLSHWPPFNCVPNLFLHRSFFLSVWGEFVYRDTYRNLEHDHFNCDNRRYKKLKQPELCFVMPVRQKLRQKERVHKSLLGVWSDG